jgi:peroxiredoxin
MTARPTGLLLAALLLAGCSSGGSGGKNVLDLAWGPGWDRAGSSVYGDEPTDEKKQEWMAYYKSRVKTEDAAGNPVKPVEQMQFLHAVEANKPVDVPVDPAAFVDTRGSRVSLADFKGKRSLVLVFTRGFPGYLCPMCTSYTAQIAHRYPEIAAAGAEVLLVFPGAPEKVQEFVQAAREVLEQEGPGALPFPVLLDVSLRNVDAFGIRGDLSKPATYVIDRAGTVRYAFVGEQPHERPDVATILAEVKRLEVRE